MNILGQVLLQVDLSIRTVLAGPKDLDEKDIMHGWLCSTHPTYVYAFNRKVLCQMRGDNMKRLQLASCLKTKQTNAEPLLGDKTHIAVLRRPGPGRTELKPM
jgi:hypothetical protein